MPRAPGPLQTSAGSSFPLGATLSGDGVNFCVFSKNSERVELLLFAAADQQPEHTIELNPVTNRTFYYWHIFVHGLKEGQLYGFRVHGPHDPAQGHRFDGEKLLIDPYAKAVVTPPAYNRAAAAKPGDTALSAMKGVVVKRHALDREPRAHVHHPLHETVIYEMHVGAFTADASSGIAPERRGTYLGVIDKIPYLLELGVTAVELLPVQHFDLHDAPEGKGNFWGYSPIVLFAPHAGYASAKDPLAPVREFHEMVSALHAAGIEVILDVVFNHTAEGDHEGPTLSFRGFENRAYYIPDANDAGRYANYSGCGNTVNGNQSIVRRLIVDCLRHWVSEMHIDGFRFDLASVLARDEWGAPMKSPPILWEIESDPVLAGTRIIAEAWDAAGLYQLGSFVGHRWAEWNGRFRDGVRRFLRGDDDTVKELALRITGSPDLYPQRDRECHRSINFVTCHDGFTLKDLVSYNRKHNEANGENNRDGSEENFSFNCGHEGETDDEKVHRLRQAQIRNFFTLLFLSQGTPMILMGDEVGRSQGGNNNPYCQNNEISWFNWNLIRENADLFRFVKGFIAFSKTNPFLTAAKSWAQTDGAGRKNISFHGVRLNQPDFGHSSHSLAFLLQSPETREELFVILNAYTEDLEFELPNGNWKRLSDSAEHPPHDFSPDLAAAPVYNGHYRQKSRSSSVFTKNTGR